MGEAGADLHVQLVAARINAVEANSRRAERRAARRAFTIYRLQECAPFDWRWLSVQLDRAGNDHWRVHSDRDVFDTVVLNRNGRESAKQGIAAVPVRLHHFVSRPHALPLEFPVPV